MGITIGVYGLDHPHAPGHFKDLEVVAGIDEVAIWAAEEAAAREQAESLRRGSYYAGGWEAMLGDEKIPAVCIFTNNREAGQRTKEALTAGKWVYADKPGAATVADMEEIVAAGEQTRTYLCPCYARRSFDETQKMQQLVGNGAIGELWSFQAVWSTSQAGLRGPENWLFHEAYAGGGIIYWLACHWLDTLRLVSGSRVAAVSAMTATKNPGVDVEDVACANLRLENGAIGSLRAGYLRDPYEGYDDSDLMMAFEGSDGALTYTPHRGEVTLRLRSKAAGFEYASQGATVAVDHRRPPGGYAPGFLAGFLEALAQGTEPPATQADALYVLRVAEAIYQAAESGQEQKIDW